jgi:histone deacetylase 11
MIKNRFSQYIVGLVVVSNFFIFTHHYNNLAATTAEQTAELHTTTSHSSKVKKFLSNHKIATAITVGALAISGGLVVKAFTDTEERIPTTIKPGTTLPIVYTPENNIHAHKLLSTVLGFIAKPFLRLLHPFDGEKFEKAYNQLRKNLGLTAENFVAPETCVTDEQLIAAGAHTPEYLQSLHDVATLKRIVEVPLDLIPFMSDEKLQTVLVKPQRCATSGTLRAAQIALDSNGPGWAVNLGGGFHHASKDHGEGFCIINDLGYTINVLQQERPNLRVLIVDLDAHRGNGHELFFKDNPRVAAFDMYNGLAFPGDRDHSTQYIRYNFPLIGTTNDDTYLTTLRDNLPQALQEFKPGLILYNAGTDPLTGDPLGGMNVSAAGLVQRDAFVFDQAEQYKVPIAMVTSGGYTTKSADVIAASLTNIIKRKGLGAT